MDGKRGLRGHRVRNPARAEARRREVLRAAARAFAEHGYRETTVDDIARKLGATKGVIYHYFQSKEEIFVEIRATAIKEAAARVQAIIDRGEPPQPTLRAIIKDLISHIFGTVEHHAIVERETRALQPENRQRIRDLQRRYERLVRGVVEEGIRQGVFVRRDAGVMTLTLLRCALATAFWYRPAGPRPPEHVVDQVVDQLVGGVLARP